MGALLAGSVLFSATDFLTTSLALRVGLSEGNFAPIALSQGLGIGLLPTLVLTKAIFFVGCCAASLIGFKMRGRASGSLAIGVLACFVVIELAVSVNNISLVVG